MSPKTNVDEAANLRCLLDSADIFSFSLSALELRHHLEARCISTDQLIAELRDVKASANLLEITLSAQVVSHAADCARCVDRIRMISIELKIARKTIEQLAPEPPCDDFDLAGLLRGTEPITECAKRHLRNCGPCRSALLEEFEAPVEVKAPRPISSVPERFERPRTPTRGVANDVQRQGQLNPDPRRPVC